MIEKYVPAKQNEMAVNILMLAVAAIMCVLILSR
jgi:hypothetical protein